MTTQPLGTRRRLMSRFNPALKFSASVLGVLLLLGVKTLTSDPTPLGPAVNLVASDQGSVTGPLINTRYGPVQVQVTVKGGAVTDVQAVQLPSGGQSGQIADYSGPILRREALAAQGGGIDSVSGATYTSQGYSESLQGALDQIAAGQSPTPAGQSTLASASA